jgi:hypothetical protein
VPAVTFAGYEPYTGTALAVTSNAVYFDVGIGLGTAKGALAMAPLQDGEPLGEPPSRFASDAIYSSGPLVHDGMHLYFPDAGVVGPGTLPGDTQIVRQNVVAAPLLGGPSITLDNPPQAEPFLVNDVAADPRGGVLWLLWNYVSGGATVLARWDGATTTTLASFAEAATGLAASASSAFVLTGHALYSVPLAGGAPVELRSMPAAAFTELLGLDEPWLFYSPDGASIVRRDISSGKEITLAHGVDLVPGTGGGQHGWADSSGDYFLTGSHGAPKRLLRLNVDGGAPEVLSDAPDHAPSGAVATDACNVYWLTSSFAASGVGGPDGPSVLMYRRKYPRGEP